MKTFGVTVVGKEEFELAINPVCFKAQKETKEILIYTFLATGSSATFAAVSDGTIIRERTEDLDNAERKTFHWIPRSVLSENHPHSIPQQEDVEGWTHLKEVKLPSIKAQIWLLIGANVPKAMEPVIDSISGGPCVVRTIVGWTTKRWEFKRKGQADSSQLGGSPLPGWKSFCNSSLKWTSQMQDRIKM